MKSFRHVRNDYMKPLKSSNTKSTECEKKNVYKNLKKERLMALSILIFVLIVNFIGSKTHWELLTPSFNFDIEDLFLRYTINIGIYLTIIILSTFILRIKKIHLIHYISDYFFISIFIIQMGIISIQFKDTTIYSISLVLISVLLAHKTYRQAIIYLTLSIILNILFYRLFNMTLFFKNLFSTGSFMLISILITGIRYRSILGLYNSNLLLEQKNSELSEANTILTELSMLDGLTSIPNRRSFDLHLQNEWNRACREERYLSLLLIDIDFFKKFNDTYGHQAGDECLQKVSSALHQEINRTGDMVARYGGEEFAAILPNDDKNGALKFAEKLRVSVKELSIQHKSLDWGYVSISIGVASIIPNMEMDITSIIKMADDALYESKNSGRNRISA